MAETIQPVSLSLETRRAISELCSFGHHFTSFARCTRRTEAGAAAHLVHDVP